MAHIRPLPRCQRSGCSRAATDAVYSGLNDLVGVYCFPHAKSALRDFQTGR